ncbi:aminotransferase class IV family protein [Arcobacter roscoffensis]|uniref:Aminotransferase class IV family protein n=1 Tax=Arcobacter roscoffensis TaxID=2961520 RepID=A0ABY5E1V0_9BACT|nr:aminotransferase class IV family protein [Arcobacter roscoffensis]UTJ06166.1 aminotransferase class IV family protein [Arcobacter roscoffensis]
MYFETIKCDDYEVFNLEYHQKRIAKTVGLNINLSEYVYPISNKLLRCKLIYDETGILEVNYFEYKKRDIKTFKLVYDENIEYSKKYLNRKSLDELYTKKENYDEIIIIKDGFISDTSIANIAIFYDNKWLTPKKPLLEGTTRTRLIEEGKLQEKDISIKMLQKCEKLALMNAMIGFDAIENYSFFS